VRGVAGFDVVTQASQVRRNIGVTAQDATLDEMLTGRQNLVMIGRPERTATAPSAREGARPSSSQFDLADAGDRRHEGVLRRDAAGAWTLLQGW